MDPPPKPTRRRKWLPWLALPAMAAILPIAYYLTRPPELVWYTTPPLGDAGHRLKVRVPYGWKLLSPSAAKLRTYGTVREASCTFAPIDTRPRYLARFLPSTEAYGSFGVGIHSPPIK